ncbi:hypothetical protein [Streptomyces indicus]|uniref:Uncharacterized protein n=1 Tax=Streptomyces indicus TaxID=417292 RepID=A0A1G8W4M4_9ACTN|nr:hypothetical protein [Streptomyces indicus]SDJ73053.1 hypothetical protein SAMN05421806_102228 [Streptomyces indicus]
MFEYEMQQLRQAELVREAAEQRRAAEARKLRRQRRAADQDTEGRVTHLQRKLRFVRAA